LTSECGQRTGQRKQGEETGGTPHISSRLIFINS
jgi:hypothetical protein